jgi:hypothetical protein
MDPASGVIDLESGRHLANVMGVGGRRTQHFVKNERSMKRVMLTFADLCLRLLLIASAHKHLISKDIT